MQNFKSLEIKQSKIRGKGVFTTVDIKKGKTICFLTGEEISLEETEKRIIEKKEKAADPLQIDTGDNERYIDLDELPRTFNHSCNPNAFIRGKNELVAKRDIKSGEEITYDYSTTMDEDMGKLKKIRAKEPWTYKCNCGAKNCRGIIDQFRILPKDVQNFYIKNRFAPDFILRKFGGVYNKPKYYNIAFDFVNIKKQVDLFEEFMKRFSRVKVKRVLDIGCGPGLQLREMAKRGYETLGLDISPEMLGYLQEKAREENVKVTTIKADMTHFKLANKVDFAFIMMGTIAYIKSNTEFLRHLNSVSNSLKSGGLYLIENIVLDWSSKNSFKTQRTQSWIMKRGNIRVKTTYHLRLKDALNQIVEETLRLEIKDGNRNLTLQDRADGKIIFPQEFLELLKQNGKFEFLGRFERFNLKPLVKAKNDNILLLRKK